MQKASQNILHHKPITIGSIPEWLGLKRDLKDHPTPYHGQGTKFSFPRRKITIQEDEEARVVSFGIKCSFKPNLLQREQLRLFLLSVPHFGSS